MKELYARCVSSRRENVTNDTGEVDVSIVIGMTDNRVFSVDK